MGRGAEQHAPPGPAAEAAPVTGAGQDPWWALRVALAYVVFAALWILLSDKLLALWLPASDVHSLAGTVKGLLFVAVTAALLFLLLLRRPRAVPAGPVPASPAGWCDRFWPPP